MHPVVALVANHHQIHRPIWAAEAARHEVMDRQVAARIAGEAAPVVSLAHQPGQVRVIPRYDSSSMGSGTGGRVKSLRQVFRPHRRAYRARRFAKSTCSTT